MQNASFESAENKNQPSDIQYYRVTVLLEPITESLWYEMKQEQQNLPALSEADKRSCAFCLQEFEPAKTYAKCLDCELTEVLICIECLRCGTESHPHTRKHRYILCDSIGPVLLDKDGPDPWGAQEDLQLLNSLLRAHLNQWPELSKDWGRKRTLPEALERLDRCFLRDEIGRQVLNKYSRGYVSEWNERQTEGDACQPVPSTSQMSPKNANYSNELFDRIERKMKESISVDLEEMDEDYSPEEQLLNGNAECSFSLKSLPLKRSPLASTSTSPVHKRRNCFDEEEISDDDLMEMRERRMSTRSVTDKGVALSSAVESTSNSTVTDHRKSRKEQLLAAAKNVAAEALRGKVRKNSLELSEAINFEGSCINGKKKSKNKKASTELLTPEQLANLCASASFNPHFYNSPPAPMDAHTVAKFDEEDLQLLTYLPFRGEFEHEYKNEAEQLISRVIFPKEDAEPTEVDNFLSEVRYARFNRYNRLMRIRAAKKATILEHNLIGEYLSIVKTNISEKGKYTVFPDRFFHSKSKEDFFRPVFFQLRQIADRETINQLARDVGAIESLKEQIEELKCLQRKGVTQLKGRLKADAATPMQWSKKRKSKKSENVEQKKAGLRWKRIKRWTKRNQHLQHPESEGSSPRQQQQQPH